MASALNMAKSTLHRRIKEGDIRTQTNAIKPFLTDEKTKVRLTFCLEKIKQASLSTNPEFDEMFNDDQRIREVLFTSRRKQFDSYM